MYTTAGTLRRLQLDMAPAFIQHLIIGAAYYPMLVCIGLAGLKPY
jgi:hypothetical protein